MILYQRVKITAIVYGRYTVAIVTNIDFMDLYGRYYRYSLYRLATCNWLASPEESDLPDWPKEMNHPRSSTTIHPRNLVEYIQCEAPQL